LNNSPSNLTNEEATRQLDQVLKPLESNNGNHCRITTQIEAPGDECIIQYNIVVLIEIAIFSDSTIRQYDSNQPASCCAVPIKSKEYCLL
jgi:hypothetical protein